MAKALYIAEKPSVAQEFAKALKWNTKRKDGFLESEEGIVTWCYGHLVTMSYPESYDAALKRWSLSTLPFLPETFKYEVIPGSKKQFEIVKGLLNREDVETIYVCTDSGREGEYIYRLVEQMAGVQGKKRKRVWIDSQTEEEILKGIETAKDLSEYDNLSASAYLRAKEDYLMGINFSRLLTLKYGNLISNYLKTKRTVLAVGRVMTCVQGMVVRREREIRDFVKTPFYRVLGNFLWKEKQFEGEFKAVEGSRYFGSPALYKENGFKEKAAAEELIASLKETEPFVGIVEKAERKKEKKNPPLLYNLAELQNECSKQFKISPDDTLKIIQELYEKKLVTYPRTDARVLSSAVAKEIHKNIQGLKNFAPASEAAGRILEAAAYKNIGKTKYVDDKKITDHYAIIPTGQGFGALRSLQPLAGKIYELIVRRFLSIFLPPAVYQKVSVEILIGREHFFASFKVLEEEGYLTLWKRAEEGREDEEAFDLEFLTSLKSLKKGSRLEIQELLIKEGETTPPKRYTSGSMILAMENAGQLIEDEELRAQIKGSGIGTSATRAGILTKLDTNGYLKINKKTQVITPTLLGELIFDVVGLSIQSLLNPDLTASWEKGLTYVAEGTITEEEYMVKLEDFIRKRTSYVLQIGNLQGLWGLFDRSATYYSNGTKKKEKPDENSGAAGN